MSISLAVGLLIAVTVLVSYKGFKDYAFFDRYKFNIKSIQSGQWYRLLSTAFLHVDQQHLLFNMITLYFFGDAVLQPFGSLVFFGIYILSVFGGSVVAWAYHNDTPHYTAVGASGGVVGILFSAILIHPDMQLAFLFFPIPIPGFVFAIGYLAYTLYGMKRQNDLIGHTAHMGGALFGVLITLMVSPDLIVNQSNIVLICLAAVVVLAFLLWRKKT